MSGVPLARRNAFADRQRLAIAVLGVGLALGLIFLLQGLWQGFQVQISAYEDNGGPAARHCIGQSLAHRACAVKHSG